MNKETGTRARSSNRGTPEKAEGSSVILLPGHTQPSPNDVDTAAHPPILIHRERTR